MVMDRHGQNLFGPLLADDILIQDPLDLNRFGNARRRGQGFLVIPFFRDDVVAKVDAFVTNIDRRSRNELADFVLTFSAERANEVS
jgi:hypothetical protein